MATENLSEAFIVYRLPGESEIETIIPEAEDIMLFDDYESVAYESGFVFYPFSVEAYLPGIFIKCKASKKGEVFPKVDIQQAINYQSTSFEEYSRQFNLLMSAMKSGNAQKVILSKLKVVDIESKTDFTKVFKALCDKYKHAFVYLFHFPPFGTWMGASPEVLLKKDHKNYETVSLAGTKANTQKRDWTDKEIEEQAIVSRYVRDVLTTQNIDYTQEGPASVDAGNVSHIKTVFNFSAKGNITGDLVKQLHPTPAVCGLPAPKAKELILSTEQHHREYYTGFLGPQNMNEQTSLFVNLRCMKLTRSKLVLFVGGGLTVDSELKLEWDETEYKAKTLLSVLEKI